MSAFLKINPLRLTITLGAISAVAITVAVWFGYFYRPHAQETRCDEIPSGSVVLVSGFTYRLDPNGNILPSEGNRFLAQKLIDCADQISAVISQQAIVEAMIGLGALSEDKLNGIVPVFLMHKDRPDVKVRTLQSFQCAVNRLSPVPDTVVILAHDKHLERAVQDLRVVFDGEIIEWRVNNVPYANKNSFNPLLWAGRELFFARPAEAFLRWAKQKSYLSPLTALGVVLLGGFECPTTVEIKQKIDLVATNS